MFYDDCLALADLIYSGLFSTNNACPAIDVQQRASATSWSAMYFLKLSSSRKMDWLCTIVAEENDAELATFPTGMGRS